MITNNLPESVRGYAASLWAVFFYGFYYFFGVARGSGEGSV